jgi:DnaJ-class molecular chaperone
LKDYYAILSVERGSSSRQIKRAYKKSVKKWHPDVHPDEPACRTKMQEINEAYEVLGNSAKRQAYDRWTQDGRIAAAAREHLPEAAASVFQSYFMKMNVALRRKSGKP